MQAMALRIGTLDWWIESMGYSSGNQDEGDISAMKEMGQCLVHPTSDYTAANYLSWNCSPCGDPPYWHLCITDEDHNGCTPSNTHLLQSTQESISQVNALESRQSRRCFQVGSPKNGGLPSSSVVLCNYWEKTCRVTPDDTATISSWCSGSAHIKDKSDELRSPSTSAYNWLLYLWLYETTSCLSSIAHLLLVGETGCKPGQYHWMH